MRKTEDFRTSHGKRFLFSAHSEFCLGSGSFPLFSFFFGALEWRGGNGLGNQTIPQPIVEPGTRLFLLSATSTSGIGVGVGIGKRKLRSEVWPFVPNQGTETHSSILLSAEAYELRVVFLHRSENGEI